MSVRGLEQAINLIQQGNLEEGARLIRIALKGEQLQGNMRASAFVWLAETTPDTQEKLSLYQQALNFDPTNEYARQRIDQLNAPGLPPTSMPEAAPQQPGSSSSAPAPPAGIPGLSQPHPPSPDAQIFGQNPNVQPQTFSSQAAQPQSVAANQPIYRTVGVYNGPNGDGTGIFITADGHLATTRFVAGGEGTLMIELEPGRRVEGRVVRAFPEIDLALIYTGVQVGQVLPASSNPTIPDNAPLTAYSHNGQVLTGQKRETRSQISPDWFPTTFSQHADAGGNPVFNEQNMLVGMLTRNSNRTSPYIYGLSILTIYRFTEHYISELQSMGANTVYCPGCGSLSRAHAAGAYYCETCGSILPQAWNIETRRFTPQMQAFYADNRQRPCVHCGAHEGYHNGECLRCGQEN